VRRLVAVLAVVLVIALAAAPDEAAGQSSSGKRRAAREPAGQGAKPGSAAREDRNAPVTVDADHLENLQKEGLVVFTGNVVARQNNSTHWADRMEVYLDASGDRIVRAVSTGNVRILTKDCRTGTAKRAEYYDDEQRIVLIGNARVWRDDNVVTGERITIYLAEDRSVVEGGKQERVKAIFYPRSQDQPGANSRPPGASCQ
jgi:lipopolysaccharide export system protein LptA